MKQCKRHQKRPRVTICIHFPIVRAIEAEYQQFELISGQISILFLKSEVQYSFSWAFPLPFINHLFFIHPSPFTKMCHYPKKIDYLVIDQLIEIYNSNIDYSVENKSVLTKLGANFCNLFSIQDIIPLVIFINKFNLLVPFSKFGKY